MTAATAPSRPAPHVAPAAGLERLLSELQRKLLVEIWDRAQKKRPPMSVRDAVAFLGGDPNEMLLEVESLIYPRIGDGEWFREPVQCVRTPLLQTIPASANIDPPWGWRLAPTEAGGVIARRIVMNLPPRSASAGTGRNQP